MSSRPNLLTPSPSNLSYTLTSTHTDQHISPHRHLPHCVQAGSGNPTAKKPTLNTSLIENYRPISLLPFIAKTLERVVFKQVSLILSQNNKLDANHSGIRSGHSTETKIISPHSAGSICCFWQCQSSDPPVHPLITGIPLCWFESFLTGSSFKVAWGGKVSKAHQLVTGVPQGSVLGPLLFSTHSTLLGPII